MKRKSFRTEILGEGFRSLVCVCAVRAARVSRAGLCGASAWRVAVSAARGVAPRCRGARGEQPN